MSSPNSSILLVGCGKMGAALLLRWIEQQNMPWDISVIEPHEGVAKRLSTSHAIGVYTSAQLLPVDYMPHCIIFAVKPQKMEEVLPYYRQRFQRVPLYISIAAGKTISFFAEHLHANARIIRAMPNTPAIIGQGITALSASLNCQIQDKHLAEALLGCVGDYVWLENESLMDAATALSGSGPAYVYYFMECMVRAGIEAGIPENIAKKLVDQTLKGSCELAMKSTESLEKLRQNVTSPGGTTEAALAQLMSDQGLMLLMQRTISAAIKRAKDLSA